MILSPYESDHYTTVDNEPHEVWMALNCGEPDGGCSCGYRCDPSGWAPELLWLGVGDQLGAHMRRVFS